MGEGDGRGNSLISNCMWGRGSCMWGTGRGEEGKGTRKVIHLFQTALKNQVF